MYTYNSGEFKHKIEIQQLKEDKINHVLIKSWETVFTTRAKSVKTQVSDIELLGGQTDKLVKKLIIRTPKSISLDQDFRVVFKSKTYEVKDLNDINDNGIYTELYIDRIE